MLGAERGLEAGLRILENTVLEAVEDYPDLLPQRTRRRSTCSGMLHCVPILPPVSFVLDRSDQSGLRPHPAMNDISKYWKLGSSCAA